MKQCTITDMTPTNTDLTHIYAYAYDLETNIVQQTRINLEYAELSNRAEYDGIVLGEWVEAERKEAELLAGFVSIR